MVQTSALISEHLTTFVSATVCLLFPFQKQTNDRCIQLQTFLPYSLIGNWFLLSSYMHFKFQIHVVPCTYSYNTTLKSKCEASRRSQTLNFKSYDTDPVPLLLLQRFFKSSEISSLRRKPPSYNTIDWECISHILFPHKNPNSLCDVCSLNKKLRIQYFKCIFDLVCTLHFTFYFTVFLIIAY